jgi:hypothetical protein
VQWLRNAPGAIGRHSARAATADAGEALLGRLIVGIEPDRLSIGLRRLVALPTLFVDQRLVRPALGDAAIQLDRRVEVGEGVVVGAGGEVGQATAVIRLGGIRRQRDRRREVLDGEGVLALALVDQSAIVVRARIGVSSWIAFWKSLKAS